MKQIELEFLRESNNIEDEWDDKSLEDAILAWQFVKKQDKLSVDVILEAHRLLMKSRTTIADVYKGKFRNGDVWIGGHKARPHYTISNFLDSWLLTMNDCSHKPEEKCKQLHVAYEAIHPFFDGNGRTGRIFYNWHRIKCRFPIHVIHTGKEQYEYYQWFS